MGGACAKHASRHDRGLAFGLFLNRDAGISSGGVGARPVLAYAGVSCALLCGGALWGARAKHASRHGRGLAFGLYLNRAGILSGGVGARPVPVCTCRCLLCGGAIRDARAQHAAQHGRGLVFGLYLNRSVAVYRGACKASTGLYVQASPVRRCAVGGACAKHASRHGRGRAFGLYLNRDAGNLPGGVGARPIPACTFRRLLCGGALWDARAKHASWTSIRAVSES